MEPFLNKTDIKTSPVKAPVIYQGVSASAQIETDISGDFVERMNKLVLQDKQAKRYDDQGSQEVFTGL